MSSKPNNNLFDEIYDKLCNILRDSGTTGQFLTDLKKCESEFSVIEFLLNNSTLDIANATSIGLSANRFQHENGHFDADRCTKLQGSASYEHFVLQGQSYKCLKRYEEARKAFKHALDLLRQSDVDNERKCRETLRIVAELKAVEKLDDSGLCQQSQCTKQELHLELFEGGNNTVIGASIAVDLKHSQEEGRHLVANRKIPPGSVVILEEPYAWSVSPEKYTEICQNCCKRVVDSVPCIQCSAVVFCNEICRKKAMNAFHQSECKVLQLLDSSEKLGKMAALSFRTILSTPLQTILDLHIARKNTDHSKKDNYNATLGLASESKLESSDYTSVLAQVTNFNERPGADLLKRAVSSIFLTRLLQLVGYISPEPSQPTTSFSDAEKIVASFLLRHLQSVSCNAYGINQVSLEGNLKTGLEIEEVGGGTYPIVSTTNHSCNPNIYRFYCDKTCIVITLQEIQSGEGLFDSYGPLFSTTPREQRQKELKDQYMFQCNCPPCLQNWPSFDQLRRAVSSGPNFKCPQPQCQEPLESKNSKRKCPSCKKPVDLARLQKTLKSSLDKYLRARESVLQRELKCPEEILADICSHITLIQNLLVVPCKELVEAQEVLKLFCNLCAHKGLISL